MPQPQEILDSLVAESRLADELAARLAVPAPPPEPVPASQEQLDAIFNAVAANRQKFEAVLAQLPPV